MTLERCVSVTLDMSAV